MTKERTTRYKIITEQLDIFYNKTWSPQGLMFFIGLTSVTAGVKPIADFISWLLKQSYCPQLDFSNLLFQVIIIILSFVCCANQIKLIRIDFKFSDLQKSFFFFTILLWIGLRWCINLDWYFTRLLGIKNICLVDLLIVSNSIYWFHYFTPKKYKSLLLDLFLHYTNKIETKLFYSFNYFLAYSSKFLLYSCSWFFLLIIAKDIFHKDYLASGVFLIGEAFLLAMFVILAVLHFLIKGLFNIKYKTIEKKSHEDDVESIDFFSEDIPIGCDKNVDINPTYEKLGRNLANKLTKQVFEEAFSVGIIGPWGAGKSSFINHVLKVAQVNKCESKTIEVIRFYPAFNHSPIQITNDFFATLIDRLQKYDGRLKSTLLSYSLKLLEATVNKKRDFQTILSPDNYLMRNRPVYKLYEDISEIIQNLPIKPIIVIDDLDRLKPDEILEVLRIIRNTANFPNTVFMVAFDKSYIINSLSDSSKANSKNYIEKYFQLEFFIPYPKVSDLRHDFINCFPTSIGELDLNSVDKINYVRNILVSNIYTQNKTQFDVFISNRREVIKLYNQYYLYVDILDHEKEVDYIDLLHFTIFKMNFPSVLSFLYNNLTLFFDLGKDSMWTLKTDEEGSIRKVFLEDFFKINYKAYNLFEIDLPLFYQLVKELFGHPTFESDKNLSGGPKVIYDLIDNPKYKSNKELSIANSLRTDLYFNLIHSNEDIPLSKFYNSFRNQTVYEFINFIKKLTGINDPDNFNNTLSEKVLLKLKEITFQEIKQPNMIDKVLLSCNLFVSLKKINISNVLYKIISSAYFDKYKVFNQKSDVYDYVMNLIDTLNLSDNQLFNLLFDIYTIAPSGKEYVKSFDSQWGVSKNIHAARLRDLAIRILEERPVYNNDFFSKLESIFSQKNSQLEKLKFIIINDEKLFIDFLNNQTIESKSHFYTISEFSVHLFEVKNSLKKYVRALSKYNTPVFKEYKEFFRAIRINRKIHSNGAYFYFKELKHIQTNKSSKNNSPHVYYFKLILNNYPDIEILKSILHSDKNYDMNFSSPYYVVTVTSIYSGFWDDFLQRCSDFLSQYISKNPILSKEEMAKYPKFSGKPSKVGDFIYIDGSPLLELKNIIAPF